MHWRTVSNRFLPRFRRGAGARIDLAMAYQRLFAGRGSKEDAEIVLADLGAWSGFYQVYGPGVSADDRAHRDGMRAVYGRIFRFLRMTDDEVRALETAARAEAVVTSQEGDA